MVTVVPEIIIRIIEFLMYLVISGFLGYGLLRGIARIQTRKSLKISLAFLYLVTWLFLTYFVLFFLFLGYNS